MSAKNGSIKLVAGNSNPTLAQEIAKGLDLSLIAQLMGEKEAGLVIQSEVLSFHQLFRTPAAVPKPGLRVLALAADIDMGGNTPIEFLLEGSDIDGAAGIGDAGDVPTLVAGPIIERDVAAAAAAGVDGRRTGAQLQVAHCGVAK